MDNDFINYLLATDQLDEFLGYAPRCPECNAKLEKVSQGFYCDNCDKYFTDGLVEINKPRSK